MCYDIIVYTNYNVQQLVVKKPKYSEFLPTATIFHAWRNVTYVLPSDI